MAGMMEVPNSSTHRGVRCRSSRAAGCGEQQRTKGTGEQIIVPMPMVFQECAESLHCGSTQQSFIPRQQLSNRTVVFTVGHLVCVCLCVCVLWVLFRHFPHGRRMSGLFRTVAAVLQEPMNVALPCLTLLSISRLWSRAAGFLTSVATRPLQVAGLCGGRAHKKGGTEPP